MKTLAGAGGIVVGREAGLIERLAALDASALAEAYDAYGTCVYRLLLSILASRDDAEDVLQESFLALLHPRTRRVRNLRAYLLAAAHNRAISMLRRRKRDAPSVDSFASVPADCMPKDHALYMTLKQALDELPFEQKEVVVLKIYCDLTFQEIARVVRAHQNTVASRYRYAIEKMRRIVGGDSREKQAN